jgi:hypothetical protein
VLRSIDKDYGGALPEITHGTFIEKLGKDQVSTGHPYAAITVPMMADAAGIYHTRPIIVLVPDDPRLGEFRPIFGNLLCLFEERPDEDESTSPNFGNAKDVIGTEKLYEHLRDDPKDRVDQEAFVRARLFDMFLGDWGRHDDQWRWGKFKEGDKTIYRPIPRDRDQAYALFDGIIPFIATSPEPLEVLQTFSGDIKNLKKYNFPARYIDRQLTNEVPEERWTAIAADLQQRLTDSVIEASVRQLPPEVYELSGPSIAAKLKSRRSHLQEYAHAYSRYLSKEVEIVGTARADRFDVQRQPDGSVQIQVFGTDKSGREASTPYYSRRFLPGTTKEIRLFGINGNDQFANAGRGRIKVKAYPDSSQYNYKGFIPNTGHAIKFPSYNNLRGIYFNLGYIYRRYHYGKDPFSWEQRLRFNYSITNASFGGDYYGIFNQVIGKWNVLLNARYDQVLKHYFFGVGNDTKAVFTPRSYYRMLTNEGAASVGLERPFAKHHRAGFSFGYDNIRVLQDADHFAGIVVPVSQATTLSHKSFGNGFVYYAFSAINNEVIPTKGFSFNAGARYTQNLDEKDRNFMRYDAVATGYIPLSRVISLVIHGGAATVDGDPEFYQLPTLGGGASLRGFKRERFYGKTVAYNQNELRFLWDFKSIFFNGKAGIIGFYDQGRVWQPGEISDTWHSGFGGGIMLVPFNKFAITVAYGVSPEDQVLNLRLGTKVF